MKLASFFADGQERFGALLDGHVVDFSVDEDGSTKAARRGIRSVLDLIEAGNWTE